MTRAKKHIHSLLPDEKIIRKIYFILEQKVMLDFDLAVLYEGETCKRMANYEAAICGLINKGY